ncbi:MAG: hypothetical protein M1823_003193 [Watsoniomyces obsoletus]|nr:MAG: hypothetical protein M1823_003193 [Watsoniomyces obsoletus]
MDPILTRFNRDFIVTCCLCGLATSTTLVRLFTRGCLLRRIGVDDYLTLAAVIIGIGSLPLYRIVMVKLRKMLLEVMVQELTGGSALVLFDASAHLIMLGLLYLINVGLIKLAIIAFLLRFLPQGPLRWTAHGVLAVIALFTVASSLAHLFQCWPVSFAWSRPLRGRCTVRVYTLQFVSSIVHLAVDLVVLTLPLFVVSRLQMNLRRKAGLLLIFSLGLVGTVATIIRLRKALDGARLEGAAGGTEAVPIMLPIELVFWSQLEVNCLIICANLPAFATLWKYIRERRRTSVRGANSTTKHAASDPKSEPYPSGSQADRSPSSVGSNPAVSVENKTFYIDEEQGLVETPSRVALSGVHRLSHDR